MSFNKLTFSVVSALLVLWATLISCNPALAQDALWRTYFVSAEHAYQQGNYKDCEQLLNSAVGASRKYDDSLIAHYYLARVCERLDKPREAEENYRIVLENLGPKIWATLRPPDGALDWDQIQTIESDHVLSSADFLKHFRHQKAPLQTRLAKPITTVDVLTDLGLLMQDQNRNQEAEQMFRQALMLSELRSETAISSQPRILQRLAKLYASENRKMESEALYKQLEDLRVRTMPEFDQLVDKNVKDINRLGKNRLLTATRLNNLALFCSTHGDYPKASSLYGRALENCDKDANKSDMMIIMRNYADLLEAMGKNEEAKRFLVQAGGIGDLNDMRGITHKNVMLTTPDMSPATEKNSDSK